MLKGKFSKYKHKLNMIKDYINDTSNCLFNCQSVEDQKQKSKRRGNTKSTKN